MESLQTVEDGGEQQKSLLQKTGEILADIVGNNLSTADTETEIELNFAVVKIKHKVVRKRKEWQTAFKIMSELKVERRRGGENTWYSEIMGNSNIKQQDDIFLLQVRLFRLAQLKWNVDAKKCSEIFNKYKIYDYIETCYDFYHIQGDEANFDDIMKYLDNIGAELWFWERE